MKDFLGQFDAKIDAKGRVRFPKTLKQQLPESHDGRFIIKRGFEKCIEVYPFAVWEKELERIKSLNRYNKKTREFVRLFTRGATELKLDSHDRLNLPKVLMDYAELKDGKCTFDGQLTLIEIWNRENYETKLDEESENFSDYAEEVLGSLDPFANRASDK